VTLSSLFFLKYLKSYRQVAIVLYFTISIILGLAIFSVPESLHLQESLWMVVLILATFFTLGNAWGSFYLLVNAVFYIIYYNFQFAGTAHLSLTIRPDALFLLSVEFTISMVLLGYVMFQYGLINKYAYKHASEAYEELNTEKQVVEYQNKEKTILLQEIHHRVKNNLQVIVSLLRMQSRELKSEEAKDSFEDAITRILTMSLIHQKLYEKESLMNIDIQDYLSTLIKNLIQTGSLDKVVTFNVTSTLQSVNAKSIVPLGLIINELVSNSMKHAFDKTGHIEVSIKPKEEKEFSMTYFDNGKWKENSEKTFGTQLIEVFTEQLEGNYKRETNELGTSFYFLLFEEEED
jgi:two-component sensor histidine kinase